MRHDEIPVKELWCHSPTVGYGMRHCETAWHKKYGVTHCLFGSNVILSALPAENDVIAHSLLDEILYVRCLGNCTINLPAVFHIVSCNEIAMEDKVHSHILTYTETICKLVGVTHFLFI